MAALAAGTALGYFRVSWASEIAAGVMAFLKQLKKAKIKIVSYDRLILNSDVDFYVTFDNEKVGRLEAQGVTAVKNSGNFAYIGGAPTDNNSKLVFSRET